jgi:hypothetical protein
MLPDDELSSTEGDPFVEVERGILWKILRYAFISVSERSLSGLAEYTPAS